MQRKETVLKRNYPNLLITISGRSGSGKTTFARKILSTLGMEKACYLNQDSYYRDQGHVPLTQREEINYDHPEAIEFDLLFKHLRLLKEGKTMQVPVYDFKTHTRTNQYEQVRPNGIIVADGIHLLTVEELRELSDLRIFVDVEMDLCFIRRLVRDSTERGRSVESVVSQYLATVRPMQTQFVDPSKQFADMIISEDSEIAHVIEVIDQVKNKKLSNND